VSGPVRWGVAGVGVAGAARTQAIVADPDSEAALGWRGAPERAGLQRVDTFEALIEGVDAVAICTPDETHAALVRVALEAGRHVVCEYPLAESGPEAQALFDLAAANERVLHVEHIELMTAAAKWIRGRVVGSALFGGSVSFQGAQKAGQDSIAHANLARLHRIVDAFGLPTGLQVSWRDDTTLQAALHYPGDPSRVLHPATIELNFRRGPDLRRRTELMFETSTGTIVQMDKVLLDNGDPVSLLPQSGLFAMDHTAAMARIRHGGWPSVEPERIVAVLTLADQLQSAEV
jgi:biliverdin reductase